MPPSTSLIILTADDELRCRLHQAIEGLEMISTQIDLTDFDEITTSWPNNEPALCLADIRLLPAPAQLGAWLSGHPNLRLCVLHPRFLQEEVIAYLQAGVMGQLAFEEVNGTRLKSAVRAVMNGEAFLSPSIAGKILDAIIQSETKFLPKKEVKD